MMDNDDRPNILDRLVREGRTYVAVTDVGAEHRLHVRGSIFMDVAGRTVVPAGTRLRCVYDWSDLVPPAAEFATPDGRGTYVVHVADPDDWREVHR